MPLVHSKSPKAFKTNVSNLMDEWKHGDSQHVKSQKQALAIAYSIKRRGKQAGGAVSPYADPPPYITRPNELPPPPSQYYIPQPRPRVPVPQPQSLPHSRRAASGGLIETALKAAQHVAHQMQGGGGALPLAKAPGTMVAPPFAGPLKGEGPGRTDRVRLDVKPGSYVFPADTVSIMGEGNSAAGQLAIKQMFGGLNLTGGIQMPPGKKGRYGPMSITPPGMPKPPHAQMKKPKAQHHAAGGKTKHPEKKYYKHENPKEPNLPLYPRPPQQGRLPMQMPHQPVPLPMDYESRMARAARQGFNQQAVHGSGANFQKFKGFDEDIGAHFGTEDQANERLMTKSGNSPQQRGAAYRHPEQFDANSFEGQQEYPVMLRANNPFRTEDLTQFNADHVARAMIQSGKFEQDEVEAAMNANPLADTGRHYNHHEAQRLANLRKLMEGRGYDSMVYENQFEGVDNPEDSYIVFHPNQIRSQFAAFDPNKQKSGYINSARGGDEELPQYDSPPTQPTGDEGEDELVPIIAADGEMIIPPELIHAKFGDLDKGHEILDKFVLLQRAKEIKRLKTAPPPKK